MRRTSALIVGGGPAGSAAAITLARAGAKPLVLERDRETQDALCGGFLSWRTLGALERLGVDWSALGGAPIERLRLCVGSRAVETRLPRTAIGVSRRALDEALLARATAAGAAVERGRRAVVYEQGILRLDDGATIAPARLILATGKHELRGLARPRGAAGEDPTLGLRLRLTPSAALARTLAGVIELHLFDRGYAGLQLQEDGVANLCLAMRRSRLTAAGGRPEALLEALAAESALLADRLGGAVSRGPIQAIAQLPYGWRARTTTVGVFRTGDQAGVIPSLAGEGVGIALASGMAAAAAALAGRPAQSYQRALARRLARPIGVADALRHLAERPKGARAIAAALRFAPTLAWPLAALTRV